MWHVKQTLAVIDLIKDGVVQHLLVVQYAENSHPG